MCVCVCVFYLPIGIVIAVKMQYLLFVGSNMQTKLNFKKR